VKILGVTDLAQEARKQSLLAIKKKQDDNLRKVKSDH
jgi:hypothetical protein